MQLNFDAIAKGNFRFNSDIGLTATIGWNINDRRRQSTNGTVTGFLVNARKQTTDLNTAATASVYDNIKNFRRSNRGYAVLAFDLFDQLFVNLSGGLEASSTVPGTFFYPAIDAAWQFYR